MATDLDSTLLDRGSIKFKLTGDYFELRGGDHDDDHDDVNCARDSSQAIDVVTVDGAKWLYSQFVGLNLHFELG